MMLKERLRGKYTKEVQGSFPFQLLYFFAGTVGHRFKNRKMNWSAVW
jgi:hypothetical protein